MISSIGSLYIDENLQEIEAYAKNYTFSCIKMLFINKPDKKLYEPINGTLTVSRLLDDLLVHEAPKSSQNENDRLSSLENKVENIVQALNKPILEVKSMNSVYRYINTKTVYTLTNCVLDVKTNCNY